MLSRFSQKLSNRYDQALFNYQKSQDIIANVFGENSTQIAVIWNNIAGVYSSMGEGRTAIDYYKKALENAKDNLPPDHEYIAARTGNLGMAYMDVGNFDQATSLLEEGLQLTIEKFGEEHPASASSMNNLGILYGRNKKYDRAEQLLVKSLAILVKTRGANHVYTNSTRETLEEVRQKRITDTFSEKESSILE